jgi:hypothetical protein
MRYILLLLLVFLATGCGKPAGTIAVGQPWATAQQIARDAGYSAHDAATLANDPPTDGFYLNLPGDRGLIIHRDGHSNSVSALDFVDNWPGPIGLREYHKVKSFDFATSKASKD